MNQSTPDTRSRWVILGVACAVVCVFAIVLTVVAVNSDQFGAEAAARDANRTELTTLLDRNLHYVPSTEWEAFCDEYDQNGIHGDFNDMWSHSVIWYMPTDVGLSLNNAMLSDILPVMDERCPS